MNSKKFFVLNRKYYEEKTEPVLDPQGISLFILRQQKKT